MDDIQEILGMAQEFHGMVTATQVTEAKIPRRCLTACVNEGLLYKADRGIYVLPDVWEDELFMLQYRYPKGIFSCETALYLHGLTDRTPQQYTMTFPKGYNTSPVKAKGVIGKIVKIENYGLGCMEMASPCGNKILVYDAERTLCDMVKATHQGDIQVVNMAMKGYVGRKEKNMNRLFRYATQIKVTAQIARYMEVLL